MNALPASTDDSALWDAWLSAYRLPVLTVADEVGTFRALAEALGTTEQLAAGLGVDARALGIHLSLIAAMGFAERREGRWAATAETRRWLHPEAEGYFGPLLAGYRQTNALHDQLLATLRTGDKAEGHSSSVEEWERGAMPAELAERVTALMNAHSRAAAKAVAQQGLFTEVTSLMDVGGGSGIFCIELARAWPGLRATVMEIDVVGQQAARYIAAAGVADRVGTAAVNMFTEEWPQGHDALFFSNVFHDWSEKTNRLLAGKAHAALAPGGRILLHEMLLDDDACGPMTTAAFSVLMLLGTRGRQYTFAELRYCLEGAGFVDVQAQRTGGGYYSLVSGRKG
ncbi:MAG: hypothetical protein KGL44_05990 [Sphingomonadales bacterium]|nr:hypothetical protein [Sphingomonadales bacterium]